MKKNEFPILEYDIARTALLEATSFIKPIEIPEHCVFCFFNDVIRKLDAEGKLAIITNLNSEMGLHPVYKLDLNGKSIAIFHPGTGAPMGAGFLEEVIALGCKKFIACGGAGVLEKDTTVGNIIVPVSAIRDEGTSYHYLEPSREVSASYEGIIAIEKILNKYKFNYIKAKTWTTDAIYRETIEKIKMRKEEGCFTVEMEAAAFYAVAKFRDVIFAQILYGGDDLSGIEWDCRDWNKDATIREKIFWLAAESCLEI